MELSKNRHNNFFLYITFFLLAFSWTNYVFISVLIIPLSMLCILPYLNRPLKNFQLYTFILFTYCAISLLLVSPYSFFDFSFYRRDGNIFISLMPLITLSFLRFNFNAINFIKKLVHVITIFNFLIYLYFLLFGNLFEFSDLYYFGFSSHNAAGGFLAIVVCFSMILFFYNKNLINFVFASFNTFTLFETGSRGSYLALILGIIFIILFFYKYYKTIFLFIFCGLVLHSFVLSWGYEQHHKIWDENDFYAMDVVDLDVRNSNNISHRIVKVWPWAIDDFKQSPIIGTGFSTFNDRNNVTQKILPGIKLRVLEDKNIYNSGHAHHSYLNILAELGLIGFLLISTLLISIFLNILKMHDFEKYLCLFSFCVLLLMSLTEHRLVAPSQAFIFFVIFTILRSNSLSIKSNEN